jgi:CheY-like chemotaxis protein
MKYTEVSGSDTLILLVEDDEQVIKLFGVYLHEGGYDVAVARTGEAAMHAATLLQPAAIILDILLPTMDGWDVLAELKASELTQDIPVLIVSVLDRQQLGFRLGAEEHLVKPVDRSQLLGALERILLHERFADRAPRVLIMHADDGELRVLAELLEHEGYEVILAHGGAEGVELAHSRMPDLAVLDLLLSEVDTLQLVAMLRSKAETAELPVVVMNAGEVTEIQERIISHDFRAVIIQGEISQPVFLQTVGHILLETRH